MEKHSYKVESKSSGPATGCSGRAMLQSRLQQKYWVHADATCDRCVITAPVLKTTTFRKCYLHIAKESTGDEDNRISLQLPQTRLGTHPVCAGKVTLTGFNLWHHCKPPSQHIQMTAATVNHIVVTLVWVRGTVTRSFPHYFSLHTLESVQVTGREGARNGLWSILNQYTERSPLPPTYRHKLSTIT